MDPFRPALAGWPGTIPKERHTVPTTIDKTRLKLQQAEWLSASTGGSNCVEVAFLACGLVSTRDSLNVDHRPQLYSHEEWQAFIAGAKAGLFDRARA